VEIGSRSDRTVDCFPCRISRWDCRDSTSAEPLETLYACSDNPKAAFLNRISCRILTPVSSDTAVLKILEKRSSYISLSALLYFVQKYVCSSCRVTSPVVILCRESNAEYIYSNSRRFSLIYFLSTISLYLLYSSFFISKDLVY
jgi:hypothetical protein